MVHSYLKIQTSRKHDYVYDKNYIISSVTDHNKAIQNLQTQTVSIEPIYPNMFSSLHHYPSAQYHITTNYGENQISAQAQTELRARYNPNTAVILATNINENWDHKNVKGTDRYRYFKKPLFTYPTYIGATVQFEPSKDQPHHQQKATQQNPLPPIIQKKKTISTQTLYRESEAQTEPYSPAYIIANGGGPTPELLALATLTYKVGLPAGQAEFEMIERARAKRAWEETLPVVVDRESFERRLKMTEVMELQEWKERDEEIKRIQQVRLTLLEKVLRDREAENEDISKGRLEVVWRRKLQERDLMVEKIKRKREKELRKITERRNNLEGFKKRDIIEEYADYGSQIYAPKIRDGKSFLNDSTISSKKVPNLNGFSVISDVESKIPSIAFQPNLAPLKVGKARADEHMYKNLTSLAERQRDQKLASNKKEYNGFVHFNEIQDDMKNLKYAQKRRSHEYRPAVLALNVSYKDIQKNEDAVTIQRIIRGRIEQREMYSGKQRRIHLINELRTRRKLIEAFPDAVAEITCNSASSEPVEVKRSSSGQEVDHPDCSGGTIYDSEDEFDQRVVKVDSRASQIKAVDNNERSGTSESKPSLKPLTPLQSDINPTTSPETPTKTPPVNQQALSDKSRTHTPERVKTSKSETSDTSLSSLSKSPKSGPPPIPNNYQQHTKREVTPITFEKLLEATVQAEYIGKTFDFLTKELERLKAERRIDAVVKFAERMRRSREEVETEKRQKELKKQNTEDIVFRQLMEIHHETVDSYLCDIISNGVNTMSSMQAREATIDYTSKINAVVDELESRSRISGEENIKETVNNVMRLYLIPEVKKRQIRSEYGQFQHQYLYAAHKSMFEEAKNGNLADAVEVRESEMEEAKVRDEEEKENARKNEKAVVNRRGGGSEGFEEEDDTNVFF